MKLLLPYMPNMPQFPLQLLIGWISIHRSIPSTYPLTHLQWKETENKHLIIDDFYLRLRNVIQSECPDMMFVYE